MLYELLCAQPSGGGRLHPVPLACGRSFDALGNLTQQLLKLLYALPWAFDGVCSDAGALLLAALCLSLTIPHMTGAVSNLRSRFGQTSF
ncbi:MAG: hypothetical protein HC789_18475 [Microcoleus sp. CSU_2_2]|nr:hypothetical protein [Microcoleus sp. SU_5_3]NJS12214.1 hypothetical protein [Microcoleus sp. CSU_2_2]